MVRRDIDELVVKKGNMCCRPAKRDEAERPKGAQKVGEGRLARGESILGWQQRCSDVGFHGMAYRWVGGWSEHDLSARAVNCPNVKSDEKDISTPVWDGT